MQNSQELAKTIKTYAKMKKISIGELLKKCELSINTLSSMQSGGYYPRLEAIFKIAEELDCSVDYLLGRTDNPNSHKHPEEAPIVIPLNAIPVPKGVKAADSAKATDIDRRTHKKGITR